MIALLVLGNLLLLHNCIICYYLFNRKKQKGISHLLVSGPKSASAGAGPGWSPECEFNANVSNGGKNLSPWAITCSLWRGTQEAWHWHWHWQCSWESSWSTTIRAVGIQAASDVLCQASSLISLFFPRFLKASSIGEDYILNSIAELICLNR